MTWVRCSHIQWCIKDSTPDKNKSLCYRDSKAQRPSVIKICKSQVTQGLSLPHSLASQRIFTGLLSSALPGNAGLKESLGKAGEGWKGAGLLYKESTLKASTGPAWLNRDPRKQGPRWRIQSGALPVLALLMQQDQQQFSQASAQSLLGEKASNAVMGLPPTSLKP